MVICWKYILKLSFFIIIQCCPLLSSTQTPSKVSLKDYYDQIFEKELPKCEQLKDPICVFSNLNSLLALANQFQQWDTCLDVLSWKSYYSTIYNRVELNYQSLQEAERILIDQKSDIAKDYELYWLYNKIGWSYYFYERGDWNHALNSYRAVEKTLIAKKIITPEESTFLSDALTGIGVLYKKLGEYDNATDYFLKNIEFEKSFNNNNLRGIALCYKHLGDVFLEKKDYLQSLNHYKKAKELYLQTDTSVVNNQNGLIATLLGISNTYRRMSDNNKAIGVLLKIKFNDFSLRDEIYYTTGLNYAEMSDFENAFHYFNQALARRNEVFGYKHYKIAEVYQALGELHARQGDWACALEHYQEALVSLNENFNSYDIKENPQVYERTFVRKELVGILLHKMEALQQGYAQNGYKKLLETAWQTALAGVNAIDLLKTSPSSSEEDKLFLVEESFPVYENALAIAADLGADYYEQAFDIMEKSKGIILLEAFKNANALAVAGIPDSLLEKESQIKYEIASLEDAIFKTKNAETDQSYQRDRLFELKKEYRALIDLFDSKYPTYHQLKYDTKTLPVAAVQRHLLRQNEALVEYFVGDKDLYIFTITKENVRLHRSKPALPLAQQVADLRKGIYDYYLSPQPTDSLYQATSQLYVENAYQLYNAVFAPIAKDLPQRVIIIPDGVLGYVPFEVLLPQKITSNATQFSRHPYLLNRHEFSYCYSATLLQEMKQRKAKKSGLLAFAPNFPNLPKTTNQSIALLRSNLDTLFYNQSEVAAIKRIFGKGKTYAGRAASKQTFLAQAPDFGIIHIATHGVLNDTASNYSFIAFTANNTQIDSNQLYVKDLYNLKLQSALVVLSACETGLGELKRGEGIISLSRGFAYAGTQSIVSTFWAVNDLSTTQIMRYFYENLKAAQFKSTALRKAKLSYIAQQKDNLAAHPFFWAAYIPIGDMRPITGNFIFYYILIGIVITAGVSGWIWKNRR